MNKSQRKLSAWQQTINKTLKGVGAILGGVTIGAAIKSTIQSASELESAMLSLQSILEAQGRSFTHANQFIQEYISDGLVPLTDAVTAYKNLTARGYNDEQIKQVMLRLKDAASFGRQSSYTLGEAVRSATEGLKNENSVLVDNAGVTKNVAKMWDEYARSIGKSRNELTQQEKIQAEVSGIMKETQFQVGDAAKYTKTYAGRLAMLSKTLQDIKITIGNALKPGAGAGLEGLIEQFSAIKSWAEANQATIQRWGQGIANAIKVVIKGFKLITGAIVENWQAIKFVGTTLLTYVAITKGAAAATTAWRIATLTLKGELMTKIPLLTAVSTAIGTYRLQMALAPVATNIFTASLLRLRAALYAVYTAIGPVGWVVLLISALISGGLALWGKYSQSLQKTVSVGSVGVGDLGAAQNSLADSTEDAADAAEDQAEAMKKAGKAAGGNIQSFDEVHQLQEDMAGSAEGLADSMKLDDIGAPGIGGFEIPDIGAQLEEMKPTLAGFLEWIKKGIGNLVNWIKSTDAWQWLSNKWNEMLNATKTFWSGMLNIITTALKGMGNVVKTVWQEAWNVLSNYWQSVSKLASDVFGAIESYIKGTWDNIKRTASDIWGAIWNFLKTQWETIKTFGENIFGILRDLILGKIDLRTAVTLIWTEIKNFISTTWGNIRTLAETIWAAIKNFLGTQWELTKTLATTIWNAIKEFFISNWEAIKEAAINIWESIKTFLSGTWKSIEKAIVDYATSILIFLGLNWEDIKTVAKTAWEWIKKYIVDPIQEARTWLEKTWGEIAGFLERTWNGIKKTAGDIWENGIVGVIKGAVNSLIGAIEGGLNYVITGINSFIQKINDKIKQLNKVPGVNISTISTIGKIAIPRLAKGGLVTDPTLAMIGEAGPEAVIPLSRDNVLADSIGQSVYRAVVDGFRIIQAGQTQQQDREVVLRIDSTNFARLILPAIIKEGQRQGLNLVVRPQGV